MAPRMNKRQLREQQELASLSTPKEVDSQDEPESGDENAATWSQPGKQLSVFAALGPEDDDSDSEEPGPSQAKQTSKKKKKKKKKVPPMDAPVPQQAAASNAGDALAPTKSQKQKKAKGARQKAQEEEGDDIDRALAELSLKYPASSSGPTSLASNRASSAFCSLLSISLANLDSEAEMKKFFGAKVISASKAASASNQPRRRPMTARSNLTKPQPTWWPAELRQGLSLRTLTDEELAQRRRRHGYESEISGEKHWTVEYSKKYKGVTKSFIHMVMSGDPEGFWQLLRAFPYHADTLLQLSEVYSHREEHSTAADFIDRALFTYERAFVGAFNFTMGVNRLDFDHVENRPFYLALHRQVSDLHRRGCVRTAFEFAKLLFSLDPSSDPHGSLFHLDFLALKTNQAKWLLDVWSAYSEMNKSVRSKRFDVAALPGWAYARALAHFTIENSKHDTEHVMSSAALAEAIQKFPSVVPVLADKADISLSSDIRSSPMFRIRADAKSISSEPEAILHLLSHLYAQRSYPLWKSKDVSKWFADTVAKTFTSPGFPRNSVPILPAEFKAMFTLSPLTFSVYRHVLVLESSFRSLFSFFPASVLAARQLACDPLPPSTRVSEYNNEFFAGAEDPFAHTARSRKQNERLLERLVPDAAFRRQLQGFFEAHPNFAQRFPGGIVQFAQIAGQLPEDALEDLFAAELAAEPMQEQVGGANMPGALFGVVDEDDGDVEDHPPDLDAGEEHEDEEDEGEEGEEDTDGEEEVAPLPVRIWRNVLGRFWGGAAEAPEEQ